MKNRKPIPALWRTLTFGALALSAFALTGCGGGDRDPYATAWYDVYGNQCASGRPRPGCNFYSDGDKITASDDGSRGALHYDTYDYLDSYGFSRSYTGWAQYGFNGILYDENGRALNDGEDDHTSRDALADASREEADTLLASGREFAKAQGLSEETGVKIARDLQGWALIGRSRARTQADIADFTKRLYGVDMSTAVAALSEAQASKSTAALEQINSRIANYWNTSPETSREILRKWYKNELTQYGVN